MKYRVEFVELENDIKPFEEFVSVLSTKDRAKVFETTNYFLELKNRNLPIKAGPVYRTKKWLRKETRLFLAVEESARSGKKPGFSPIPEFLSCTLKLDSRKFS